MKGDANNGVSFPIAFNNIFSLVATWSDADPSLFKEWKILAYSTTGFTAMRNDSATIGMLYAAIGK